MSTAKPREDRPVIADGGCLGAPTDNTQRLTGFSSTTSLLCPLCQERVPMPLGTIDYIVGVSNAFVKAHRNCKRQPLTPNTAG